VTVTDEVDRALRRADFIWPDRSRSQLISAIVLEWAQEHAPEHDEAERQARIERRLAAIERTSGSLDEAFHPGYLEELRQDWPE